MPLVALPNTLVRRRPASQVIGVWSFESVGRSILAQGGWSYASATYPAANRAIYVPFVLPEQRTVVQMWSYNGAAVGNNLDLGIYDASGNRLVSIGSTAQSGTSVLQQFNITDTTLAPDQTYYMAIACNGTTSTLQRWALTNVGQVAACGVLSQSTAFALPATATMVAAQDNYIPLFGLQFRSVI